MKGLLLKELMLKIFLIATGAKIIFRSEKVTLISSHEISIYMKKMQIFNVNSCCQNKNPGSFGGEGEKLEIN